MDRISAADAAMIVDTLDFRNRPAEERRLLTTAAMLYAHLPDEEIEVVRDEIYVSTGGYQEAICISETKLDRLHGWVLMGTTWDRSGGVSSEQVLGTCMGTELVALLRALLERIRRDQD